MADNSSMQAERDLLINLDIKCREMLDRHKKKSEIKNRMVELISKAQKLLKNANPNKKTARAKLDITVINIKRELKLLRMDIKKEEENIIRQGCPGIQF
jgi:PP-loop superfamily ATP-utilizing enzyme